MTNLQVFQRAFTVNWVLWRIWKGNTQELFVLKKENAFFNNIVYFNLS